MTEDYVSHRRERVAQIRGSFEQEETPKEDANNSFLILKLQFLIAVLILCGFLFMKLTGTSINGVSTKDFIDIITDNHYYTNLQNHDIIKSIQ